jgi:hypothetical protein
MVSLVDEKGEDGKRDHPVSILPIVPMNSNLSVWLCPDKGGGAVTYFTPCRVLEGLIRQTTDKVLKVNLVLSGFPVLLAKETRKSRTDVLISHVFVRKPVKLEESFGAEMTRTLRISRR